MSHTKSTIFISIKNIFLISVLLTLVAVFLKVKIYKDLNITFSTKMDAVYACDFEVFGKVQGVFFRKYTQQTARKLNLVGWCENTLQGTVHGQLEGPKKQLHEMKKWLQERGSPQSRIDRAIFSDIKQIDEFHFNEFSIRR